MKWILIAAGILIVVVVLLFLVGALLLSRKAFVALAVITVVAASTAFILDLNGLSRSQITRYTTWAQFAEFLRRERDSMLLDTAATMVSGRGQTPIV